MNISIIGATGYSGVELIRLLHHHPYAKVTSLFASSQAGKEMTEVYPHLMNIAQYPLEEIDINATAEWVFIATPSGISSKLVPSLLEAGRKVIDLSGDFRLPAETYETWYGKTTADSSYLQQAVYGLPEWFKEQIQQAQLIANPGCYPTAAALGLAPAMPYIDPKSIIIDAKSGVSGAGRAASLATHYGEVNENLAAYKVAKHQHTPEIEQTLNRLYQQDPIISFTPHLVPMTRGILCTMYATITEDVNFQELYQSAYEGKPFVRLRPQGSHPKTKEVYGSNYCDIALHVDKRTNRLIILSVIDNVVKGAAGQAIQNMNIMAGLEETTGLTFSPVYP
ncbi:N-acetyl-gamma-glutamyl-phosphate reductase [Ammoniphilus sp. CFH 90114]|uniref:N-acetyl-gamma-glutamyl-phosphate reductase n=1 Tax=Ammoniphilus sp. CFH 90114 TaxID=2493665 RepID=UPI00100EA8B0|nr:N-acetyl-gamma-glutamyl-phosphate reductase [Ammoniphilus sp. CFH 90114]RXT04000.1 N-acetyl-gamma-glutamyl-phosphate reductase [Ammoniphilus sp. CFH 90114]